jgi:hypothetical protein
VMNRVKRPSGYDYHTPGSESGKSKRKRRGEDGAWLTLSEAAERLGIDKDQARQWSKSGRFLARRRGLGWQVDRDGLEHMIEDLQKGSTRE